MVSAAAISLKRFFGVAFPTNTRRAGCDVGLEVGGHNERPDWPKLGPSVLIATALVLAIRTAKWSARHGSKFSNTELDAEIDYSVKLVSAVLSKLLATREAIFPQRREPWYQPDDADNPK